MPVSIVACGGGAGGERGSDPVPPPVDKTLAGAAVVKVREAAGICFALAEKLRPLADRTIPERHLRIIDPANRNTATYLPAEGWSLLDFAVHPSAQVTVVLGTNRLVRLARLDRTGRLLAQNDFIDPAAAGDPFIGDPLHVRDAGSLLPWATRDAARLAPAGEDAVLALRTGRNAVVAYRLRHTGAAGTQIVWRSLVEPGVPIGGIGLTSGSFDPFGGLDNQWQVFLDVDSTGTAAIGVNIALTDLLEGHRELFGQVLDPAVSAGVLVTRLGANGARLGSHLIDTVRKSEIHALRWIDGRVVLGGRVLTERRPDGGGWDAFLAFVQPDMPAVLRSRTLDVDRGDIVFDIASLPGGRMLVAGCTGYLQNPAGGSISEEAMPLLAIADAQGRLVRRITVSAGPRHNQLRSLAPSRGDWLLAGLTNGPGTHSADGNAALLFADGFVRQISVAP